MGCSYIYFVKGTRVFILFFVLKQKNAHYHLHDFFVFVLFTRGNDLHYPVNKRCMFYNTQKLQTTSDATLPKFCFAHYVYSRCVC